MLGIGTEGPVGHGQVGHGQVGHGQVEASSQGLPPEGEPRRDRGTDRLPPARAMDPDERDAWAVLATVEGLGPAAFAILLAHHGSARQVLDVARSANGQQRLADTPPIDGIRAPRGAFLPISEAVAEEIVQVVAGREAIVRRIADLGIRVVTLDDPEYPVRLTGIHLPPAVLFVRGSVSALARSRACAVVGTRHPTGAGRVTAARISAGLVAANATVVSGLALGIDGAAHEATIREGGVTVAVLGSGLGAIAPAVHRRLAEAIITAGGAVVSELGTDVQPSRGTFPRRNRLISGLSDATVVVEAPARSGALLTAAWAMDQGRGCFIVPGAIDAPSSAGCLSFLREFHDAARVVTGVAQLIADLGYADEDGDRPAPVQASLRLLGTTEARVADAVLRGQVTVDELVAVTGLPVATVLATLTLLERQGLIVGAYGRYRPAGALLDAPRVPPRR